MTSKKFDFTTRLDSTNKVYIEIGKGIELFVRFIFNVADNKKDAELIKRETMAGGLDNDEDDES